MVKIPFSYADYVHDKWIKQEPVKDFFGLTGIIKTVNSYNGKTESFIIISL